MYNLTREQWLWTMDNDKVSLEDALLHAHEIRGLQDTTALMLAAEHRMLLAVLHRSIDGPRSMDQWAEIWQSGKFPGESIEEYLAEWESRFELYGSVEVPGFMQAYGPIPDVRERNLNKLVIHGRAGGNVCLFGGMPVQQLAPDRAARNLMAIQAFALGGGSSGLSGRNFADGACARGIVFLLLGRSLFETLMLNLLPYPATGARRQGGSMANDKPAWEQASPFGRDSLEKKQKLHSPQGLTDLYTWPSRRVVLIPDRDSPTAIRMQYTQGLRLGQYRDPQQFYPRKHALRLRVGRSRERTGIFGVASAVLDEENRIDAVTWIDRLRDAGLTNVAPQAVVAIGQASNLGAVLEEKIFTFPFPVTDEARERTNWALESTKTAEGKLWAALGRATAIQRDGPEGRDTDLKSVDLPPSWREMYHRRVEDDFCKLISGEIDNATYLQRLAQAASRAYSDNTALYPASAIASGEGLLRGGLKKAGIIEEGEEDREEN